MSEQDADSGSVEEELARIVGRSTSDSPEERPSADDVEVRDALVAEIESTDSETVARAVELLRTELERAEDALAEEHERAEDLESRLKRKQADFQNYKKRQEERMEEEIERATEDLVTRLLDVRDNLDRALQQDEDADIRGGVESTLEQFDRELGRENVEPIEPEPGDDIDPVRHEVLVTIASDQPEDSIAEVHRPGYEMSGKVLRPAQVAVSDGPADEEGDAGEGDGSDSG
jgi:molecular chaperone GrpE